jgi:hypothetical protein
MKSVFGLLATSILLMGGGCTSVFAKKKKPEKVMAQVVEAYTRELIPAQKGGLPVKNQQIVILWQYKTNPTSFFWRGDAGWAKCRVDKAKKIVSPRKKLPFGLLYDMELVKLDSVKYGDTLMITPINGAGAPLPAEIPDSVRNTLFFQTNGSKWIKLPVPDITKKRSVKMQ